MAQAIRSVCVSTLLTLLAGCTAAPQVAAPRRETGPYSAFARCLSDGGLDLELPRYEDGKLVRWIDLAPGSTEAEVQVATNPCLPRLPSPPERVRPQVASDEWLAAAGRFATCMRRNGISAFPDPIPMKGLVLGPEVNARSHRFQRAESRCEHLFEGVEE
jgi:hypothetical protein